MTGLGRIYALMSRYAGRTSTSPSSILQTPERSFFAHELRHASPLFSALSLPSPSDVFT